MNLTDKPALMADKGLVIMKEMRTNQQTPLQSVTREAPLSDALQLLTPQELAVRLRLSLRSVRRLVAAGRVPYRLVGTVKRFVWAEVVAALPKGPVPEAPRGAAAASPSVDMYAYIKEKARNWRPGRPTNKTATALPSR